MHRTTAAAFWADSALSRDAWNRGSQTRCSTAADGAVRQALCVTLLGLLWASTAGAQTNIPSPGQLVPKTVPPESAPPSPTLILPEREQKVQATVDQIKVNISRFTIEDADPELVAVTTRVLSPLRDHPVMIDDIYAAIAEVEQDYVDRGHFLTRIIIPPQHVSDGGELRLKAIHGFIQSFDLGGIPTALRRRISAVLAPLVNNPSIKRTTFERALLIVNDISNLNLKASLHPGQAPGSVILMLTGQHRAVTGQLVIDDSLPKLLGKTSATLSAAYSADSEPIDQMYLTASAPVTSDPLSSNSPRSLLFAGIRSAVGISGAALDANLTWSRTRPKSTPDIIDTDSTYQRASLSGTYPLVKIRAGTLIAQAELDAIKEAQNARQFGSTLYDDELRVVRLGLAADRVFSTVLQASAGLKLSRGVHALGSRGPSEATPSDPLSQVGASDVFTKWEWHAALHRELREMTLDLQVRGQQAARPLLLSEKFTLGGPTDLSGYDTASFTGDRGWAARGELQRHLDWQLGSVPTQAEAYTFAARGKVEILQPTAAEQRSRVGSSAGLGIRASSRRTGGSLGPVDLTGELARQINPSSPALPDHWRINLSAAVRF